MSVDVGTVTSAVGGPPPRKSLLTSISAISFARRSSRFSFPELAHVSALVGAEPETVSLVDLGLVDPFAERLNIETKLVLQMVMCN